MTQRKIEKILIENIFQTDNKMQTQNFIDQKILNFPPIFGHLRKGRNRKST